MTRASVLVVTGYGINADRELGAAFSRVGARVEPCHLSDLIRRPEQLDGHRVLAFPGGFSFGDHLGSGKVLAFLVRRHLRKPIEKLVESGGLVIGICNGFQILVKAGLLPNSDGRGVPEVSLVHNDHGTFVDRWARLRANRNNDSPWLRGLSLVEAPIRHGEGRFITGSAELRAAFGEDRYVAFRYDGDNPNGSEDEIAGLTDATGRILGLMPHPEAFLDEYNHPEWPRRARLGDGLALFRNAVAEVTR